MYNKQLSWNDRFALIDHFKPSDAQICSAFAVDQTELDTARTLRASGTFTANPQLDVAKYPNVFAAGDGVGDAISATNAPTAKKSKATVHTKPESATKKTKPTLKRGRKGDKIQRAFQAVTTTPVSVTSFMKEHDVSLAVLRQSSRFLSKMEPAVAKKIGKINVRQDKTSKQLMIWREDV